MCVIISLDPKQSIDKEVLRKCYDHNHDGWGIMWAENGKLEGWKCCGSFKSFIKTWKDVPRHAQRGIHFRIKTHGATNTDNCHPFNIGQDLSVMHNGIIQCPEIDKDMSDTHNFVKYELAPLVEGFEGDFMTDPDFKSLIEDMTGYSKLLIMDTQGRILRTNDKMWVVRSGIHFSNANSFYEAPKVVTYSSYGHNSYSNSSTSRYSSGCVNRGTAVVIQPSNKEVNRSVLATEKNDDEELQKYAKEHSDLRSAYSRGETDDIDDYYDKLQYSVTRQDINPEETEDDAASSEVNISVDLEELATMPDNDLMDLIMDYPKSVMTTLKGLLNTCIKSGIVKLDVDKKEAEKLTDKNAA